MVTNNFPRFKNARLYSNCILTSNFCKHSTSYLILREWHKAFQMMLFYSMDMIQNYAMGCLKLFQTFYYTYLKGIPEE